MTMGGIQREWVVIMDKLSQKEKLLKLFRDNGNMLSLGMILKTDLADEWRARLTELRQDGYNIP